jgi:hypothetical protein
MLLHFPSPVRGPLIAHLTQKNHLRNRPEALSGLASLLNLSDVCPDKESGGARFSPVLVALCIFKANSLIGGAQEK